MQQECTGCELCVIPCPVDCIDMVAIEAPLYNPDRARKKFNARQKRIAKKSIGKTNPAIHATNADLIAKKAYIQAAIEGAKQKKPSIF